MVAQSADHWASERYRQAAAFVPLLTTTVLQMLDVQKDDIIMDIGCGDGILTQRIAELLTDGAIYGIDASPAMIEAAKSPEKFKDTPRSQLKYDVLDATKLLESMTTHTHAELTKDQLADCIENEVLDVMPGTYSKVFSNAALHWILRKPDTRQNVFTAVHKLLKPGGHFVFEMGGHGNVAEMHAALISAVRHGHGIDTALAADPWFFPDESWMTGMLEQTGFVVEEIETEHRPTKAMAGAGGGVEGWVRLMGQSFIEAVPVEEREALVRGVVETLEPVCTRESGEQWIGYVRLRVKARKA